MESPLQTLSQPSVEELTRFYVLDGLKGFGPQKFKQLYESGIPIGEVIADPRLIPISGKRAEPIRAQLADVGPREMEKCRLRAEKQLALARSTGALVLTYGHPLYPKLVYESNNPIPVLYVRGNAKLLVRNKTVACVGSRKIRPPYSDLHRAFVRIASEETFTIVSGFALGADTVGHSEAVESGGTTVCVMPSGLDRPFPPENKDLWQRFLSMEQAVFVSEFAFGTGAASLNLRKRNKLITAFARGVLISQTSADGGAMNAYRFAIEQKKPIATFSDDGTPDTDGNREIAVAEKPRSTVFRLGIESQGDYVSWLRGL